MKPHTLHYIATRVFDTPLAIHPGKLETILSVIGPRLPDAFKADMAAYSDDKPVEQYNTAKPVEVNGNVAVIPIHGTLVHRCLGIDALSGMTSYQELTNAFNAAVEDRSVDAILLDIDSPGGEVNGLAEFAERIYEARGVKPIIALANEQAFSAAYWIGSAAEKLYVTRTAGVGSIGVIATHVDQTKADEKAGLKYTHVIAGKKKANYSSHRPLSREAFEELQAEVDAFYGIFVSTVSRNRSISPDKVRGTEAGLFMGKSAVVAGLADEVISLSELSEKIQESISMKTKATQPGAPAADAQKPQLEGKAINPEDEGEDKEDLEEEAAVEDEEEEKEEEAKATPAAPAPAEAAAAKAAPKANDTQAVLSAAAEISNMCTIVGAPQLAADFIKQGLSVEAAKAKLFDKLAAGQATIINAVDAAKVEGGESEDLLASAMRAHVKNEEERRKARR